MTLPPPSANIHNAFWGHQNTLFYDLVNMVEHGVILKQEIDALYQGHRSHWSIIDYLLKSVTYADLIL